MHENMKSNSLMGASAAQLGCVDSRQSVAQQILQRARFLAEKSMVMADKVHAKLEPVMSQSCPQGVEKSLKDAAIETFPPYFDCMRDAFSDINKALDSIEEFISRTEI